MELQKERHEPTWIVEHNLLIKLEVIIEQCDLLNEMMEPDTPNAERLARIRMLAKSAVNELSAKSQCGSANKRGAATGIIAEEILTGWARYRDRTHKRIEALQSRSFLSPPLRLIHWHGAA